MSDWQRGARGDLPAAMRCVEVQAQSSNIVRGPSPTGAAVMTAVGSGERERHLRSR
jgi:hypothetical protein